MSPDPVCALFLNIGGKFYFYLLFQIIFFYQWQIHLVTY